MGRILMLTLVLALAGCEDPDRCEFNGAFATASPSGGDGLVPTDSWIWLEVDTDDPPRCFVLDVELTNLDTGDVALGDPIPMEAPDRTLWRLQPTEELDPEADYEVRWRIRSTLFFDTVAAVTDSGVVSFRTDVGPGTLPATPQAIGWRAEVDGPRLGRTPEEATDYADWLELWTEGGRFLLVTDDAPDDALPDRVWRVGSHGHVWSDGELNPLSRTTIRFAAVGLNAQMSPWSDPVVLEVPRAGGTGQGAFEEVE